MKIQKRLIAYFLIPVLLLAACATPTALINQAGANLVPVSAQTSSNSTAPLASAQQTAATQSNPLATSNLNALSTSFEQVYQKVDPSVVAVTVMLGATNTGFSSQSPFQNPFQNPNNPNSPNAGASEALGSGIIWDTQGHIITNNHVVAGATSIEVTFSDGTSVPAKVVGTDPNTDLAVIQVSADASHLVPIQVGDSTQAQVGQVVIAIGNPFGLQNTMTEGIISGLSRSLPVTQNGNSNSVNQQTTGSYTIPDIIQTDAAINPGNSGGALVNTDGQLLGVTSAIDSPVDANSGVGFVIPTQVIKKVVPSLISTGTYQHSYLGLSGTDMTPDLAQANGLPASTRGALIVSVTPGGPSATAGLQGSSSQASVSGSAVPTGGDVITAINGQAMNSFGDVISYLFNNTQPGQTITLTILRNGAQQNVKLTLGVRPTQ